MAELSTIGEIIDNAITEIQNTPELCEAHPKVCAFASESEYRRMLVRKAKAIMEEEEFASPYDALEVLETQLSDDE